MSNSDTLILAHLKHIRGTLDLIEEDLSDIKNSAGNIAYHVDSLKRNRASVLSNQYNNNQMLKRFEETSKINTQANWFAYVATAIIFALAIFIVKILAH